MPRKGEKKDPLYSKRFYIVDEGDFVFLRKLYADQVIDWDPNQYLDALEREALWDRESYKTFFDLLSQLEPHLGKFFPANYCSKKLYSEMDRVDIMAKWFDVVEALPLGADTTRDLYRLEFLHWWLHCGAYKKFCESTDPKEKKSKLNPHSTAAQPFIRDNDYILGRKPDKTYSEGFSELSAYKKLNWRSFGEYKQAHVHNADIKREAEWIALRAQQDAKGRTKYWKLLRVLFADPSKSGYPIGSVEPDYSLPQRPKIAEEMRYLRLMEQFHWLGDYRITDWVDGKLVTYVYPETDLMLFYETHCSWGNKDKADKVHPMFANRSIQEQAVEYIRYSKTNFLDFYSNACKTVEYFCAGIFPMPTSKEDVSRYKSELIEGFTIGNAFILKNSYSKATAKANRAAKKKVTKKKASKKKTAQKNPL